MNYYIEDHEMNNILDALETYIRVCEKQIETSAKWRGFIQDSKNLKERLIKELQK